MSSASNTAAPNGSVVLLNTTAPETEIIAFSCIEIGLRDETTRNSGDPSPARVTIRKAIAVRLSFIQGV